MSIETIDAKELAAVQVRMMEAVEGAIPPNADPGLIPSIAAAAIQQAVRIIMRATRNPDLTGQTCRWVLEGALKQTEQDMKDGRF